MKRMTFASMAALRAALMNLIVALHLSSVSYYILVDNTFVQDFRKIKFGKK